MSDGKVTYVWDWTALLAYFAMGLAIILLIRLGLDWIGEALNFDDSLEKGGRRSLGIVIAIVIGLPLTRLLGRLLGLTPQRVKQ